MSAEQNIKIQQRWGEEVASQGKLEVLDEILADDFADHDPAPDQGPGVEGLKDFSAHCGRPSPISRPKSTR